MTELVVIVPSRGRPQAAVALANAIEDTIIGDTDVMFVVDDDDPTRGLYAGLPLLTGPHRSMVEALNHAAVEIATQRRRPFAVGFMGDDHRPRTAGWDQEYLKALHELGTGLVYGNDLLQGERVPTQVAMTTDIIRVLGYMAPPDLGHMYVDNAWLALGHALGRIRYLPDVVVEHMHPVAGKADWDDGYKRVNHPGVYARDQAILTRWVRDSLPVEAARLRRLLDA